MKHWIAIVLCLALAITSDAKSSAKKIRRAYEAALEGAQAGNCDSMASVGAMLCINDFDHAEIRNLDEGIAWLRKGVAKGCPRAQYELAEGLLYSDTDVFDSVIMLLDRAAAAGYTEALYKAGLLYLYGGHGTPCGPYVSKAGTLLEWDTKSHYDLGKAGQYFQQAAAKGHPGATAQLEVARAVADNPRERGIAAYNRKDYGAALGYFVCAWIDKDPLAMIYLGNMYALGLGVKQDNFFPTQSFYRQAGYYGMPIGFYMAGQLQERFGGHEGWQKDTYMDAYKKGAERGSTECAAALERIKKQDKADWDAWVEQHALAREARQAAEAAAPPAKKSTFQWYTPPNTTDADRQMKAQSDYDKAQQRRLEIVIGNGR